MSFESGIRDLWENDFVQTNAKKAYKVYYPQEYALVADYLNGGSEPNFSNFSRLGKGLCEMEKHKRSHSTQNPPPPNPANPSVSQVTPVILS